VPKPNRNANRKPKLSWHRQLTELLGRSRRNLLNLLSRNPVYSHWQSLTHSQRLFLSNIGIAVLIAVVIAQFHQNRWLVRLENSAMDTMMEFNKGLPRMSAGGDDNALQFTYLDIDDASYRVWNEPYHTPRDKILRLVKIAAENRARLIVLDIDLSRAGTNADNDQRLAEYLAAYGRDEPQPPLILVRTFYNNTSSDREWTDIRPSFLDEYEFSSAVQWAQPLFRKTMWDGVVRQWHLVKSGCLKGQLVLLPAAQLVATTLLAGDYSTPANQYADLSSVRIDRCSDDPNTGQHVDFPASDGRNDSYAPETDISQRLIYTMPWDGPAPDLVTVSAHLITDSNHEISDDLIANRVVIVGASFAESGDIHRTPIGEMPGALIIANAIKSLSLYGQIRSPPAWAQWVLRLALIMLAAWVFSRFTSLTAICMAGAIIIGALVPISFYFFKYGLWLDFAVPLFAMMIHRAVAEYRYTHLSSRAVGP